MVVILLLLLLLLDYLTLFVWVSLFFKLVKNYAIIKKENFTVKIYWFYISSGGAGSHSPLHNTPSPTGMSFSSWMTQSNYNNNNTSPSPSPPSFSGGLPPGFIHPPGMSQQDLQATLEQYQRKLAFHEPRPCPTCRRMYRDAATLRTHIAIMHSEGKEPFACSCGAYFRTKYDMYQHKKNGHR